MATARPSQHKRGRGRPRLKLPIRTIASFYRQGATLTEIAASFGVSVTTIHLTLVGSGVELRHPGQRRSTPNLDLPDGGIGLSPQTMAYYRRMAARGS